MALTFRILDAQHVNAKGFLRAILVKMGAGPTIIEWVLSHIGVPDPVRGEKYRYVIGVLDGKPVGYIRFVVRKKFSIPMPLQLFPE